jgi:hypothetical protein
LNFNPINHPGEITAYDMIVKGLEVAGLNRRGNSI